MLKALKGPQGYKDIVDPRCVWLFLEERFDMLRLFSLITHCALVVAFVVGTTLCLLHLANFF